jgi:hypothetical protein
MPNSTWLLVFAVPLYACWKYVGVLLLAVIGLRSCPHKLNTPEPHPSVERVAIRDSGALTQPYPPVTLLLALPAATILAAAAAAAAMLGLLYWQLSKNRLLLFAAGESVRAAYCSAL